MATAAGKKSSRIFVWIILILLIAGLAGFGANGLGGTIRSVGSVGETEITVEQYQRGLQQDIQTQSQRFGTQFSVQQALQLGIDRQTRARLVATAALDEEARVAGVSVGDTEVARQLQSIPQFRGVDGNFDREGYEFALAQNGLRPSEFEDNLRATASRQLLQQAITGGLTANPVYSETIYTYLAERRDFRWARINDDVLIGENPEPTQADIDAFYAENEAQFMTPETRKLSYVKLTPDMLLSSIEVDEDALRSLYDARATTYNQPERRLVERLAFPTMDDAVAAKAAIEDGSETFEALVEARNLTLEDVDLGDVSREDLDLDIADAVFALSEPGIADPVQTSLGPALFRINAVLEATSVSFEEAREELLDETTTDRARRIIQDEIDAVDDLLASGATLEEVADETDMEFGTLDYVSGMEEDFAAYEEVRTEIQRITSDDFAEVRELSDGGIFAIRLDSIVAPALPALDDIRDEVTAAWDAAQTRDRQVTLAETLRAQMENGTPMETLGLVPTEETEVSRTGFIEDAPEGLLAQVFEMEASDVAVLSDDQGAVLVELTSIITPDLASDEAQQVMDAITDQNVQTIAADVFELFGQAAQTRHGLTLNQAAINAVHQQFHQ